MDLEEDIKFFVFLPSVATLNVSPLPVFSYLFVSFTCPR